MIRRFLVLLVLGALSWSHAANASRVRIEHQMTLVEVTTAAHHVFEATVTKLDHVYNGAQCYGEDVTYMAMFRALVRVEQVLKGSNVRKGQQVWLLQRTLGRPCKYVLVEAAYQGSIGPGEVEPGTRLLVYTDAGELQDGSLYMQAFGLDGVSQRAQVEGALVQAPPAKAMPPALSSVPPALSSVPPALSSVPSPTQPAANPPHAVAPPSSAAPPASCRVATRSASDPLPWLALVGAVLARLRRAEVRGSV
jgi:hypothetical protein